MGIFGITKYLTVPVGAAVVWLVIVRGSYKPVERILILLSLIYFTYPVSAFLAHPDWPEALRRTVIPQWNPNPDYIVMIVGLIGTTVTPWMQFYLQASIVEKGITEKRLLACAVGRDHRLHRDRRDRVLHRGGVRRDDVPIGAPRISAMRRRRRWRWRRSRANSPRCCSPSDW